MMYWIVFALFRSAESVLDPLLSFWLPFYTEGKMVLLLFMVLPTTNGSGWLYIRLVHPFLCRKEMEIDRMLAMVQDQGYSGIIAWIQMGLHWAGKIGSEIAVKVS